MPQDLAGLLFACQAHPPLLVKICASGFNTAGGPKEKQDVKLCHTAALNLGLIKT